VLQNIEEAIEAVNRRSVLMYISARFSILAMAA
jgi:hypothetical protein